MYLAENTDGKSLANILPENMTIRIIVYTAAFLVFFALACLPTWYAERRTDKKLEIK